MKRVFSPGGIIGWVHGQLGYRRPSPPEEAKVHGVDYFENESGGVWKLQFGREEAKLIEQLEKQALERRRRAIDDAQRHTLHNEATANELEEVHVGRTKPSTD